MPQGEGLGFVSKDVKDIYRDIPGVLALKDPFELKPPYRVRPIKHQKPTVEHLPIDEKRYLLAQDIPRACPTGALTIKVRLQDEQFAVVDICKGPYMKWAIAESLAESLAVISGVQFSAKDDLLFCMDQVKILDVHMPYSGSQVWQFCEFRFDYLLLVDSQAGDAAADLVFGEMAAFERIFCKALESKFRDIYHLTILGLSSKQYALISGRKQDRSKDLFLAAQQNDIQSIKSLLADADVDVDWRPKECAYPKGLVDEDLSLLWVSLGRTALLGAAEEGHVEAMTALLEAKANVNAQDNSGFHALYLAAGADEADKVVKFLLSSGADVNLKNKSGYTALHNACGCGEVGAIKALVEAKADVTAKSSTGAAPVHVAVINNQPAALEALAQCKVNLDMPAFGGNTAVHEAVMQNNPDIIQKLVDLKANANIESGPENKFATPLKMALDRKKKKASKKLQELGAVERIEGHEYEEISDGEFEPAPSGGYVPKVKGRIYS